MDNDNAGSGHGEEATSPTSLLSLPDELLRAIFRIDYAEEERPLHEYSGLEDPLPHYIINKRICSICRPLLHSQLPINHRTQDQALASLVRYKQRRKNLRKIGVDFRYILPHLTFAVLSQLQHLTSLTVDQEESLSYPVALTNIFTELQQLQHLKLKSRKLIGFEDESFRFSQMPSLRHLELGGIPVLATLALGTRRSIKLKSTVSLQRQQDYPALPWSGIRSLVLPQYGAADILDRGTSSAFWKSLELASQKAAETTSPQSLLPLESLTFLVNSTSPRAVTNWPLLLNLLAATNLKALHLARFFPVDVTASQIPLKTVTTLTMTGEIRLREASYWPQFLSFLELFPNLNHLSLEGNWFQHTEHAVLKAAKLSKPDSIQNRGRYPYLFLTLDYLRGTPVCDFRYRSLGERHEMRWSRSSRVEAFEAELWTYERDTTFL